MKRKIDEHLYERIWAVSDIHGHFSLFKQLFERLNIGERNLILVLGDSCDRGPDTVPLYRFLKELENQGKLIHVKGNHEDMLWDAFNAEHTPYGRSPWKLWSINGGVETQHSISESQDGVNWILDYIGRMPLIIEGDSFVAAHAWVDPTSEDINYERILWGGGGFDDWKRADNDKRKIIVGHYNLGEIRVDPSRNMVCVDTQCYERGRLGAYEIKTGEIIWTD